MRLLLGVLATALAVWVAVLLVPGIRLDSGTLTERVWTLVVVAAVIGVVNAVLQPIAKTVGCLLYVLTLGLFGLVVNGLLFWLSSWITGRLGLPFEVDGFWAAFWGALVVSVVGGIANLVLVRPLTRGDRDR
ncbi:phage holin family protein [Aquipuribacter nitratireducens]|uniref:Phage holin family protein n=1 Tax=Aquipuribacter nitratireducens TaxID=650104 RepID=A0ABW0GSW6_9MICO